MCTAATYKTKNHYFGRNLDLEFSYNEQITITPRNFPLLYRKMPEMKSHYALIGMAIMADRYPLYFDATNESGLSMAGLNFPDNAVYNKEKINKENIAPFEFIPWILGQCASVDEAEILLEKINLVNINFNEELTLSPLHWIISDRERALTVESVKEGIKVYDNPVGILTNNPPFEIQMFQLNNYMNLTKEDPKNSFAEGLPLNIYSRGMGALGLPGDLSSLSRFVKAAYIKLNSVSKASEAESVSQMFHILGSVEQQRGCVITGDKYEITVYTSCCNTDKCIYYYTTYDNRQITAVDMYKEDLEGKEIIQYPLIKEQQIRVQN